jgi:cytochrome c oxidase assembly protein subunit 15
LAIILLEIELAVLLSVQSTIASIQIDDKVKKMLFVFLIILLIQAVLGTRVRMYVDDVSKAFHYGDRGEWLADKPISFLIHRSFSWLVLLSALFMAWYCKNIPAIRNKVFTLNVIILLSMITGIVLFYADMPAVAQPIHLLLASFAITQTISILLQTQSQKTITNV